MQTNVHAAHAARDELADVATAATVDTAGVAEAAELDAPAPRRPSSTPAELINRVAAKLPR